MYNCFRCLTYEKKIYCVVEKYTERDKANIAYDVFMMITIVASIFPLFFKQQYKAFVYIDYITASIFIVDYILRFITADYKLKKGKLSFVPHHAPCHHRLDFHFAYLSRYCENVPRAESRSLVADVQGFQSV